MGALLVVLGLVLPWASAGALARNGLAGDDAKLALLAGFAVIVVAALPAIPERPARMATLVLGFLVLAVGLLNIAAVSQGLAEAADYQSGIGVGLPVLVLEALVVVGAGVVPTTSNR